MTVMGKVGAALRTVVRREGAQLRGTLLRLAAFGALALAALVATAGTAGDPYSGTNTAGMKTGGDAWIVMDAGLGGIVMRRAAPVAALTTVQVPDRVTAAGLAAKPAPPGSCDSNWDDMKNIRTSDPDPGGKFQFNPCTHQVRISDTEKDGHLVRGGVALGGTLVVRLRAAGNPAEDVATIPHYDPKQMYIFKVCLAGSDKDDDSYCDSSDSQHWPNADRGGPDPCYSWTGKGAEDNCHNGRKLFGFSDKDKQKYEKWRDALRGPDLSVPTPKLPVGRKPDINARPDLTLPRGQPGDAGKITQPVAIMLRWLVWTVLGGCVAGFVIVGGRMTIRHRRGEFGANASELGWVVLAVVVAGSGMAIAFVSLLVDPF
ncbi:hypothetical protein GCM10009527_053640 [Actinomadura nitritigenes]|uniref:Uncharacterized protein n=1 Tax=Actinomadura nitritigenes TaxID=134602 RepID=A0ABS3RA07_9ACTN|nr:hypothetical protein [Actinomadura nitritigenes]MBO2443073.1 hypothetical protein [Actinomadura nitritigenes]